jgi:hypothetical protein
MAKRNRHDGWCSRCAAQVRAGEGVLEAAPGPFGYLILCVECAPARSLELPRPVEASRLPSIHAGESPARRSRPA